MPDTLAAKIQAIDLAGTSLRMPCPEANAAGTEASDTDVCLPNFMQACNMISLLGRPGYICPSISLRRPVSPIAPYLSQTVSLTVQRIRNLTQGQALPAALNNSADVQMFLGRLANETQFLGCPQGSNVQRYGPAISAPQLVPSIVTVDPELYGYAGCSCDTGYTMVARFEPNGSQCMSCTPKVQSGVSVPAILVPTLILGTAAILAGAWLVFNRRQILEEIECYQVARLKKRHPPGTLAKGVGKSVGLVFQEVTLVMTDVQGSTELWEWNPEVMNKALSLHDETLRTLLPLYSGFEVTTEGDAFTMAFHDPIDAIGWALHVQHQLLALEWPTELLSHPVAAQEAVLTSTGDNVLFRGLRVRMGINTGKPASIQVQPTTKQLEYIGEMVRCTDAIVNLPVGGQVLMGAATFLRTNGRLHQLSLPPELYEGPSGVFSPDMDPDIASDMARRTQADLGETIGRHSTREEPMEVGQSMMRRDTSEGDDASLSADLSSMGAAPPRQMTCWQWASSCVRRLWCRCRRSQTNDSTEELNMALGLVPKLLQRITTLQRSEEVMPTKKQTCMIMDMGVFLFPDLLPTTFMAGSAIFGGTHIIQVLSVPLAFRAMQFPPLDPCHQLAPSFMDAPGATNVWLPGKPELLTLEKPNVIIAFASTVGLKELTASSRQLAETALQIFQSCLRTTLLLLDGYECQEKDGGFMLAFADARTALEWAASLQLALIRQPWHERLQIFQTTQDILGIGGELLSRGLPAKISIFSGEITKVCPHTVTGRADYFGSVVNRSARLLAGAQAGQILVEEGLVRNVVAAWNQSGNKLGGRGLPSKPAALSSSMAVKNCRMLSVRVSNLYVFQAPSTPSISVAMT
ncbi:hypothetical protein WJX74_004389 [Apatococcus lobatus]|uniref:Guanylate cyclase domain-containing protein n=1 Tax=Apatococcus lobatus TaxID=904363 RepID=A0AAW1QM71_9CHLO